MNNDNQVEGWLDRAITDLGTSPDFVAESLALDIAEQLVRIMEEQGVSRSALPLVLIVPT